MDTKRKYDLEERLIGFALTIVYISERLPKTYLGTHFAKQIVRSGTSPAFQYAEACDAESRNDFIHKLKIGVKELRETLVCLKIIDRKPLIESKAVIPVIKECDELISILTTSIKTARNNASKNTRTS
ncbi:MAG: four helix bundle protein [Balneolaceae bacterium]|nr:four helix bundle protein [Balneolaceae bacterium]MBO6545062.1 four helix bundle protein [Balneolaceae bacterium]MBO6646458.1 four helix bundle protein [Balneolaceae bacterium]